MYHIQLNLLINFPPNSELLLNNSLLKLNVKDLNKWLSYYFALNILNFELRSPTNGDNMPPKDANR